MKQAISNTEAQTLPLSQLIFTHSRYVPIYNSSQASANFSPQFMKNQTNIEAANLTSIFDAMQTLSSC